LEVLRHSNPSKRRVWLLMLIDLVLVSSWVFGFFFLAGAIAWLADRLASFHLEGMERVRKLQAREKEREGAK